MTRVAQVDAVAREHGFSGVVRVDRAGEVELARAYGWAHRAFAVPTTVDTVFGLASGAKLFTALTVLSLVQEGVLTGGTTARELLRGDLPLIDDAVTVEMLLAHRSGIGDYLDEEAGWEVDDYVLPVPVHTLADTGSFLPVLDGYPQVSAPGRVFSYCNGGYIVLALLAERASGVPFHDLVHERVCRPAGLVDTAFRRGDELPARVARGYLGLDGDRTNVLHLPVRGNGDGGIHSTAADLSLLWTALCAGRVVSGETVALMTAPRSDVPSEGLRYGLGTWLHATGPALVMEGYDPGVSMRSTHDPTTGLTVTVLSNTSEGAWPLVRHLAPLFD